MISLLYAFQMATGSLSTFASTLIATMVIKSENKLQTPFRRLIFGLSIGDICQSISFVFGPLMTPADIPLKPWNIGNQTSCDVQGFIFQTGTVAVVLYTFSLCVYYHHVVRLNMSDDNFAKTTERKLHAVALVFPLATSTFYLVMKCFNSFPEGTMCFVFESPYGCENMDGVECLRGRLAPRYVLYLTFIPTMLVCVFMAYTLTRLCHHVINQDRISDEKFRQSLSLGNSASTSKTATNGDGLVSRASRIFNKIQRLGSSMDQSQDDIPDGNNPTNPTSRMDSVRRRASSVSNTYVTRGQKMAMRRRKQTMTQALLYVGCYLFIYTLPLLSYFVYYRVGRNQPLALTYVEHILFPFGGVCNIIIYSRPKVSTVQKRAQLSWWKALWEVVKAGGDLPTHLQKGKRRSTHVNRPRPSTIRPRPSTISHAVNTHNSGRRTSVRWSLKADAARKKRSNERVVQEDASTSEPKIHKKTSMSPNDLNPVVVSTPGAGVETNSKPKKKIAKEEEITHDEEPQDQDLKYSFDLEAFTDDDNDAISFANSSENDDDDDDDISFEELDEVNKDSLRSLMMDAILQNDVG